MSQCTIQDARARRRFIQAALLSLSVIAGSMFWTWRVGQRANDVNHRLGHAQEGLQDLKRTLESREAKRS